MPGQHGHSILLLTIRVLAHVLQAPCVPLILWLLKAQKWSQAVPWCVPSQLVEPVFDVEAEAAVDVHSSSTADSLKGGGLKVESLKVAKSGGVWQTEIGAAIGPRHESSALKSPRLD